METCSSKMMNLRDNTYLIYIIFPHQTYESMEYCAQDPYEREHGPGRFFNSVISCNYELHLYDSSF